MIKVTDTSIAGLERFVKGLERPLKRALNEAARNTIPLVLRNTRVDTGTMAQSIKKSEPYKNKRGFGVYVYYDPGQFSDEYYAGYVEYGHGEAEPDRAMAEALRETRNDFKQVLGSAMKLRLKGARVR